MVTVVVVVVVVIVMVVVVVVVGRHHHHSLRSSQKPYTIVDGSEGVIQKTSRLREASKLWYHSSMYVMCIRPHSVGHK